MKTPCLLLLTVWVCSAFAADTPAPTPPAATAAPPPSATPRRGAAELEKLVEPIALYPDPLIATILPASVYPLEIVQAARFVADTNNLAKLDAQPWDANVKAVARVPAVIQKMNEDLAWTMELGEAFLAQDKDLLDAIQTLRGKAQKLGTLKTTPQQVVVVTNMVVETRVEQRVVVVTNTVVQIQPANPQVVYVPTYNPAVVYYPLPPAYVGPPPVLTFAAGVAVGAIIANNCDWHGGGVYIGGGGMVVWGGGSFHGDVDIDVNRNVNVNQNVNVNRNANISGSRSASVGQTGTQQKWQPDPNRLSRSGTPTATTSASRPEARGWSSGASRPSAQPGTASRPSASTGGAAARPSTGTPVSSRPVASPGAARPSPSPGAPPMRSGPSASGSSFSSSAFAGAHSGANERDFSKRGASSRSVGGGAAFSGGGGGGRR